MAQLNAIAERTPDLRHCVWIGSVENVSASEVVVAHTRVATYRFVDGSSFDTRSIRLTGRARMILSVLGLDVDGTRLAVDVKIGDQDWSPLQISHVGGSAFGTYASDEVTTVAPTWLTFRATVRTAGSELMVEQVALELASSKPADGGVARYNQVVWVCAHNAFSNMEREWVHPQQWGSLTTQMQDYGVRGLMIDVNVTSAGSMIVKHWRWPTEQPLDEVLAEIETFLLANPREIITIFLQNDLEISSYPLLSSAIQARSVLYGMLFLLDRENSASSGGTWLVSRDGAPTLDWMRNSNRRCVLVSDSKKAPTPPATPTGADGWPYVWAFFRESVYGGDSLSAAKWADEREDSLRYTGVRPLQMGLINHFPTFDTDITISQTIATFEATNDSRVLANQIDAWMAKGRSAPNFVAVDFVNFGMGGGVSQAVGYAQDRLLHPSSAYTPPPDDYAGLITTSGSTKAGLLTFLKSNTAYSSKTAIVVENYARQSLRLVASKMANGDAILASADEIGGAWSERVLLQGRAGGTACWGIGTTNAHEVKGFWLFRVDDEPLYIYLAVLYPYWTLFYNPYVTVRIFGETADIRSVIADPTRSNFLESNYHEENPSNVWDPTLRLAVSASISSDRDDGIATARVRLWNT